MPKSTETKSSTHYKSLNDLPLSNWIECLEGNLQYTRCGAIGDDLSDFEAWCNIYDQYIAKYGLNKQYKELLEVLKKKALIQCDYVITRDKFSLTLLEIEEQNLKMMLNNRGTGMTIEQTLVHLSKFVGYWLRAKDITTGEYFTLLDEFNKTNKIDHGKKNK